MTLLQVRTCGPGERPVYRACRSRGVHYNKARVIDMQKHGQRQREGTFRHDKPLHRSDERRQIDATPTQAARAAIARCPSVEHAGGKRAIQLATASYRNASGREHAWSDLGSK